MKKYVIIGNSTAGIHTVEGIRSVDKEGTITLVSDESYPAYGRPLISYYLYGKTTLENMQYRSEPWYKENKVNLKLGVKATKIDKDKKQVLLSNGETLPYDKLMVATGSRPFVPPMSGLESVKKTYSFMTVADALEMEKDFEKTDDVLIVGAGLIGLKCTEGILNRVSSVTVVDMANRVLPSILDEEGSAIVQKYLEDKGVKFFLSDSAAEFNGNEVTLKSGKKLNFTKLVLAVGVRPNTELVLEAGGKVERGIVVDGSMQTTVPDVYAAGDNTVSYDITSETNKILALLPNAAFQGVCAGKNMAGEKTEFSSAIPMNAMGIFDLHMMTAGTYAGETYEEKGNGNYKKLFYQDNVLKGFILIGNVERAGIYTSLIRNKTPLDSVDFELLKTAPALSAFSKEYRKAKFTKEV